jgi:hypothetical protein
MQVEVGIISHKPQDNELLERCIKSLIRTPAGVPYNLILQFTPGSYAENWNRLMARANAEFVCILEDDTAAIRPMWLRSLAGTMVQHRDAAIVMPIETKDGRHADPGFRAWQDKLTQIPATYGFCNLIRREVGLEADENLTYFTDVDLAYQAYDKGWTCLCNGHVWLLHGAEEGRMTSPERDDLDEIQKPDKDYLEEKWKKLNKAI